MSTYIIRKKVKAPSLQAALENETGRILEAYDERETRLDTADAIGFSVHGGDDDGD